MNTLHKIDYQQTGDTQGFSGYGGVRGAGGEYGASDSVISLAGHGKTKKADSGSMSKWDISTQEYRPAQGLAGAELKWTRFLIEAPDRDSAIKEVKKLSPGAEVRTVEKVRSAVSPEEE